MSSPQLPLSLRFPPDQRFDSFVATDDGAAVALLRTMARGEHADWVLVSGPPGSGKTHLLLATCAEAHVHGRHAAYLPLATLGDRGTEALASLERADLVALDGIEATLGDHAREVALFDFHNRARASGASVLYAAEATPASLPATLPDLRSRLAQCTQVVLSPLEEAARRDVLRRRAAQRGLQLDDSVVEFLFRRVGRDLATLTELLDRIDRESLAARRRVTVPFLRTLLERRST